MSAQIANLIVSLDEIDDDISCREADVERDPDDDKAHCDLDDLYCRRADVVEQLKELDHVVD